MSNKKFLGTLLTVGVLLMSAWSVYKDASLIEVILWPLIVLVAALYGIKLGSGFVASRNQGPNNRPHDNPPAAGQ